MAASTLVPLVYADVIAFLAETVKEVPIDLHRNNRVFALSEDDSVLGTSFARNGNSE